MKKNNKFANSWTQRLFKAPRVDKTGAGHKTYYGHLYAEAQKSPNQSRFSELFSGTNQPYEATQAGILNHRPTDSTPDHSPLTTSATGRNTRTRFTVLNCYNETPDTKTFRLARTSGEPLSYLPGQYMTLTVTIAGREYKRSYSLASSPVNSGVVEITVKRDANGGLVSNWLVDYMNIGDTLIMTGPYGKFTCAAATPDKILFLAAGSGIVPIMSMLRWLADTEKSADIFLLLSFRTDADIIYRQELELLASRHRNIRLIFTVTQQTQSMHWNGLTGRIDQDMLEKMVSDIAQRAVYLCGPDAFMADCRQNLRALGHPPDQLFYESFCVDTGQTRQPAAATFAPVSRTPGSYQVRFVRSGVHVNADGCTNLLDLAAQAGIEIEHECRSGSCGECMIKCLAGKVDLAAQAEIDEIDRKQGWVYACCAYPASNVQLDI